MIKNIVVLIFFLFVANLATAEVTGLYLETEKTTGINRGYTLPAGSTPKWNINLGLDIENASGMSYVNTKLSTTTDRTQFRYGGIDIEFGINMTRGSQLYFRHYSGHVFDSTTTGAFPQENVIGLRFNLLGPAQGGGCMGAINCAQKSE